MVVQDISEWRRPDDVLAPSYLDKNIFVKYGISADLTGVNKSNWRRTPLYWVWLHLHGKLPPFNNSNYALKDNLPLTFCTLKDAVACFQGLNRPHVSENNGDSVLVYVLDIAATVEYAASMVSPIKAIAVPKSTVLTVHVCLNGTLQNVAMDLEGIVTKLEFVIRASGSTSLPAEHGERYAKRHW